VGTQTGVLSLAALLTLIGIFFVKSFIVFGIGRKKGFYEMLGSGMVCGVAGYMASAFFVDSTVSVTPLLFFILGIGIVCVEKASAIKRKNRIINKA
jgi:hypothetical protein